MEWAANALTYTLKTSFLDVAIKSPNTNFFKLHPNSLFLSISGRRVKLVVGLQSSIVSELYFIWKNKSDESVVFRLSHGEDVDADGNCLFTASQRALNLSINAKDLRRRTVNRFLQDLGGGSETERENIDAAIKHMYSPDLRSRWGIHVVQEVKLLAKISDRQSLDVGIDELVSLVYLECMMELVVNHVYRNARLFMLEWVVSELKSVTYVYTCEQGDTHMDLSRRLSIVIDCAKRLAHLHSVGIIHRDIKLANVLLDENFVPLLIDIGLSRRTVWGNNHVSTEPM